MRIWPQCIPCIMKVRLQEIQDTPLQNDQKIEAMTKFIEKIQQYISPDASTVRLATIGFRLVKELTGVEDPYKIYKEESTMIASNILGKIKERISGLKGYKKFRQLVLLSINSNMLDPGTPYNFTPDELEQILFDDNLKIDHTKEIFQEIFTVNEIIYLLDNCGEAVFDLLLVKFIRENTSAKIFVVAKGKPYQNDVLYSDALRLGFQKYALLLSTESDAAGPFPDEISKDTMEKIKNADLVISKGMANYEAYLDEPYSKNIAFLLKAKCIPVATSLGVNPGDSVAYFKKLK